MWPKFPDICLTVEENPGEKLNQEIHPTWDRTRARWMKRNEVISRSYPSGDLETLNLNCNPINYMVNLKNIFLNLYY